MSEIKQPLPPPSDADRRHAEQVLDQLEALRLLGGYIGQSTHDAEVNFVALMLRNERMGLTHE